MSAANDTAVMSERVAYEVPYSAPHSDLAQDDVFTPDGAAFESDAAAANCCLPCDDDDDDCAICLQPLHVLNVHTLSCTHSYHGTCLKRYVDGLINGGPTSRPCACPLCAAALTVEEMAALGVDPEGQARHSALLAVPAPITPERQSPSELARQRAADRTFAIWARRCHVKLCPSCNAPIEKRGGCPSMMCQSCHSRFNWNTVPLAFPCRGFHCGCFPPIQRCKHFTPEHHRMTPVNRCIYTLSTAACVGAACVAVLPFAVAMGAKEAGSKVLKRTLRKREERRRRARFATYQLEGAAAMEATRQQMTICRQTGTHGWINLPAHGIRWCHQCGLEERTRGAGGRGATD